MSMSRYSVYVRFQHKQKAKCAPTEQFIFNDGRKYVEIDPDTGLLKRYCIDGIAGKKRMKNTIR